MARGLSTYISTDKGDSLMLLLKEVVKERQQRSAARGFQPQTFIIQPILTRSDLLKGPEKARGSAMFRQPRHLFDNLAEAAALDPNENETNTDSTPDSIEDLPFICAPCEITESEPDNRTESDIFEVNPSDEGASEFDVSELPAESSDRVSERMAIVKLTAKVVTR